MSDSPEDDTIRVRRSWSGRPPSADAADDDLDEVTAVSRRRGVVGEQAAAEPDDAVPEDVEPDQPVRHRATFIDGPEVDGPEGDGAEDDRARREIAHDDQPDGSTIVARRESRRRASRDTDDAQAGSPIAGPAPAEDHVPAASSNHVYPVRPPAHIIAEHLDRAVHAPQTPVDGDKTAAERRRAARRATVIVVTTASIVVISAAAALIGIVLSL